MTDYFNFDSVWDYQQPDVSEQRFRDILATVKSAPADYYLQVMTQLARAQGIQGNFALARQTLNQVSYQLTPKTPLARVRYLLELGRVRNSSGQSAQASPLFHEAFELAAQLGEDYYAIDAAHMLGISEPPDKGLAWNLKALDFVEGSKQPQSQSWRGPLYNNIGWTYHDMGQYEQALVMFQHGVEWRQGQGQERATIIARYAVARCLRSLKRVDAALVILRELEPKADGYVNEELGECLLLQGDTQAAAPYLARAYQELSQDTWLATHEPQRLKRLQELSQGSR